MAKFFLATGVIVWSINAYLILFEFLSRPTWWRFTLLCLTVLFTHFTALVWRELYNRETENGQCQR